MPTSTTPLRAALADATHLVQSIAPGPTAIRCCSLAADDLRALMPKLEWVGYLSTVGVYGDHDGAWVDEETHLPAGLAALGGAG